MAGDDQYDEAAMRSLLMLCLTLLCGFAFGQEPQPLLAKDYGQWESLRGSGTLSPDGKWLVYDIRRSSGDNETQLAFTFFYKMKWVF